MATAKFLTVLTGDSTSDIINIGSTYVSNITVPSIPNLATIKFYVTPSPDLVKHPPVLMDFTLPVTASTNLVYTDVQPKLNALTYIKIGLFDSTGTPIVATEEYKFILGCF